MGSVPSIFKKATVKPVLKKPNTYPQDLFNYRPLSILPFWLKLLALRHLKKHIAVQGTVLSWFHSNLSNRNLHVSYNNKISEFYDIQLGLPQGSVYMLPLGDIISKYCIELECRH